MSYVVSDDCTRCKSLNCVDICPVGAFYGKEGMLVIDPDECVSCGNCELVCPALAIKDEEAPDMERWAKFNRAMSRKWPNIQVAEERAK